MQDPVQTVRRHPLITAAAASVIVLSAVGTAKMLDLLPDNSANAAVTAEIEARELADAEARARAAAELRALEAEAAAKAAAEKAAADKAAAERLAAERAARQRQQQEQWRLAEQQQAAATTHRVSSTTGANAAVCTSCGIVTAISEQPGTTSAPATGAGAVAGAVVGGVIGNQVGKGDGRRVARIAGMLGGAYAGHMVEGNVRKGSTWVVSVRFDDGRVESYTYAEQPQAFVGMLVKAENGQLLAR